MSLKYNIPFTLIVLISAIGARGEPSTLEGERLKAAAEIFADKCSSCHEADGKSEDARLNLADAQWNHGGSLAEIETTIRSGVPDTKMKGMKGKLTDEQIADLAIYVKTLAEKAPKIGGPVDQASPPSPNNQSARMITAERPAQTTATLAKEIVALRILPSSLSLTGAEALQRIVVIGMGADGLERDVTGHSHFKTRDAAIAGFDDMGRLASLNDGETHLEVFAGGRQVSIPVTVQGSHQQRPFSFARNIGDILTKQGCNTSDCHGGVKGKGGLKLSLNAIYPHEDYKWIVEGGVYKVLTDEQKEPRTPRINREHPEQSLLLLKPTRTVSHGGGKLFETGSRDYQTILQWIRNGAPFGNDSQTTVPTVNAIQIEPKEFALEPGQNQQILVSALLSDGRREDITDQVRYKPIDGEIARVSSSGAVQGGRLGETVVMVRAAGHAASARVGIIAKPIANYPNITGRNFIDKHVLAKLKKFNLVPAGLADDATFLRRVCLDVTGTLPPVERAREFLADTDPTKRDKLIDTLLNSPQYVDFWAYRFADLFRMAYWTQQSMKNTFLSVDWIRNRIARNVSYDQIASERIAPPGNSGLIMQYYRIQCVLSPQEIAADQFRVFYGVRLECAECHNHPFETWTQNQFWEQAAFFSQLTLMQPNGLLVDFPAGTGTQKSGKALTHPRTKQPVQPAFLDGTKIPDEQWSSLRMQLARWMTSPENTQFAKATVNRMWGYFFGRGLVDPVDDFRSTNPPTHPELLDELARDFVAHQFDLKHLIRTIVQSRTYQQSGEINETNREDRLNYARFLPRPLDAIVLLDAISVATAVEEQFLIDSGGSGYAPRGSRAVNLVPDLHASPFLAVYGRPTRQAIPDPGGAPTLTQALHILTGVVYTEKIGREGGRVDRLAKSKGSNREAIEEMYLAALTRYPSEDELADLDQMISKKESRKKGLEDLGWALISSPEFAYNH